MQRHVRYRTIILHAPIRIAQGIIWATLGIGTLLVALWYVLLAFALVAGLIGWLTGTGPFSSR